MKSVFDKYTKKYDKWYEKNKFAFLSELKAIRKVLPRKANMESLEIGVGTGRFASTLGITKGIDPSYSMLKVAQKRGVDAYFGTGENIPFKDKTFDCAIIVITLCFVKNPKKVLKETARILKKNGRIVIGIVDKKSFLGKFYQKKKSVFYKKARFYSVKKVTQLLKKTGFSKFSFYQTLFIFPDKMKSQEQPKRGYGKGGFVVIAATKK